MSRYGSMSTRDLTVYKKERGGVRDLQGFDCPVIYSFTKRYLKRIK